MDAFHTLAADRLIDAVADNQDLIPFTWALCRMFNVLIMMTGIVLILLRGTRSVASNLRFVLISSVVFGVAAYITIYVCAHSTTLPKTQFPDSFIKRP